MHGIGRHWLMAGSTVNSWLACPILGSDLPEWRLHVLIMWVPPIVQKHAMFGSLKTLNSGGLKVRKNVSCQSHPDCNNGASEVAKLCDKQFVICSADSQKPNHDYTRKKISMCSALDICFLWSVFETWSALFCRQKTANKESVTFAVIDIIFFRNATKVIGYLTRKAANCPLCAPTTPPWISFQPQCRLAAVI